VRTGSARSKPAKWRETTRHGTCGKRSSGPPKEQGDLLWEWTRRFGNDGRVIFGKCKQRKHFMRQRMRGHHPGSTGWEDEHAGRPGNRTECELRETGRSRPRRVGTRCENISSRLDVSAGHTRMPVPSGADTGRWPHTPNRGIRPLPPRWASFDRNLTSELHPSHMVPLESGIVLVGQT
jgi:hypothetical protein